MSAEQTISVPSTPGDATPSLRNQSILDGLSLCTITDIYLRLGEMQATVKEVKEANTGLQQRLSESNKQQEQLISELRDTKQQVAQLTLKLAESEKVIQQLQAEDKKLASQIDAVKVSSAREQEQVKATSQALKQQIEQATARAEQSEKTATEIAAKEQGLFATTERNEKRLNKLQWAFNSVDSLKLGEKQEVTGVIEDRVILKFTPPTYVYKTKIIYLSPEEQAAFKAMGEALKIDEPAAPSAAAAATPAPK